MKCLAQLWGDILIGETNSNNVLVNRVDSLKFSTALIVCSMLYICPVASGAQLLDYGVYNGFGLGKGILGNDFSQPLTPCISGTPVKLPASQANIRVSIVTSEYEYRQAFHIEQKAQASFLGFGGGEELHIGQSSQNSGGGFDIVLEAYSEADSDSYGPVSWVPPYDALMQSGDLGKIKQVRAICGDRYIATVFNEERLFIVIHVYAQKFSTLSTFSGRIQAQFNVDPLTASTSLGGDKNVSTANQSGALNIEVVSEGIGGLVPTAEAVGITSNDGLVAISQKLASYLKNDLHVKGQPVKYQLAPLPWMQVDALTDDQIYSNLSRLKSNYQMAKFRLGNIESLLSPMDQRRQLLLQPQADVELQNQQTLLSRYVTDVAAAHKGCRQAMDVSGCTKLVTSLDSIPPFAKVEMPPITQPLPSIYAFSTDGTFVLPSQNSLIASTGGSIFESTVSLVKSSVRSVSLGATISSPYLSYIDLIEFTYNPVTNGGWPASAVGAYRIFGQEVKMPGSQPYLEVLRADASQRCSSNIFQNGMRIADSACLTYVGKMLKRVAFIDMAHYASVGHPGNYTVPLMAEIHDCFAPVTVMPIGTATLTISNNQGKYTGIAEVTLASFGFGFNLSYEQQTHDSQTWAQLAQSELMALNAPRSIPVSLGPNPCAYQVR